MANYVIHNVRFYDFEPKAIQCMSYEDETNRLALSRSDGSIEIWNCENKPFLQQVLPGDDDSSVEGLTWCEGRLFSAGLHGFILEHNVTTGEVLSRTAVTGGPTWSLALSPDKKMLAAGTEEGYVCMFDVLEKNILYNKTLEKQEGRILHLSWHSSGDYIVTGSINCIRLWSLKDGRVTRFSLSQSDDKEIIVWCVGILDDMTVISGDSRGKTCFWNGKLGMITDAIQTHKADVLCLAVCSDQKSVYVAGVDPVIVQVNNVVTGGKAQRKERWVKSYQRNIHTHDIRALELTVSDRMYSGGVDTILTFSYYPPKTVIRFHAQPPHGSICVASAASCLLLRYQKHLELWQMGSTTSKPSSDLSSHFLPIAQNRVKLLEVRSREGEVISWCAVSPKALWFLYIVSYTLRIFQFYPPSSESQASVRRIRGINKEILGSYQAVWIGEAKLASATVTGVIQIISVSEIEASVEKELTLKAGHSVVLMAPSSDGAYLVVADSKNHVVAYNLESGDPIHLPRYNSPVTAIGVHPTTQEVVVAHADMMLKEFNLVSHRYTNFSRQALSSPPPDLAKRNCIVNISFDSRNPSLILLHDSDSIIVLDKSKDSGGDTPTKPTKMKRGLYSPDTSNSSSSFRVETTGAFSFVKRSNQVIHFSYVRDESVISVELNPLQLLDKLPPTLKVKKFGAG